jgi:hypothetical protein
LTTKKTNCEISKKDIPSSYSASTSLAKSSQFNLIDLIERLCFFFLSNYCYTDLLKELSKTKVGHNFNSILTDPNFLRLWMDVWFCHMTEILTYSTCNLLKSLTYMINSICLTLFQIAYSLLMYLFLITTLKISIILFYIWENWVKKSKELAQIYIATNRQS